MRTVFETGTCHITKGVLTPIASVCAPTMDLFSLYGIKSKLTAKREV
jgi:hypothetical protein